LQRKCKYISANFYSFTLFQFIVVIPLFFKNSFAFEKGLEPKNPLYADSGDG
jgi:hypothetical protein